MPQWPAGANDTKTKPTYSCTCGAVSSSPINHNHGSSGSNSKGSNGGKK